MVTEMNMRLKGPMCERGKLRIFVASGASQIHHKSDISGWAKCRTRDTAPLDAVSPTTTRWG
jgi:hypothetical protein